MDVNWKVRAKLLWFRMHGMKPFTYGYSEYKRMRIEDAIEPGRFNAANLPKGHGFRLDERVVEYPWLLSRLPDGPGRMLDAGSTLNYTFILGHPKMRAKSVFISTLAPEPTCYWKEGVSYVYEDLRQSCFRDNYFDWVASISTVEHIGMDNTLLYTADETKKENNPRTYLQAIREFHRVLKPGGTLYLSMPFGRTGDYGWFQVFTGEMIDELIEMFDPETVAELYFKYEADGWRPATRDECRDAEHFDIHKTKAYNEIFLAASGSIVCLELVKPK